MSSGDIFVKTLYEIGTIHTWKSWKVLNALDSNYWLGMCLIWLSNKFTCTKPVSKVTKSLIYIIYIMYIQTHITYILYRQFVTTWSNIVIKWCAADSILAEINPVIVINLLSFASSESGYLVTDNLPTPRPALMSSVAFSFRTTHPNSGAFFPPKTSCLVFGGKKGHAEGAGKSQPLYLPPA